MLPFWNRPCALRSDRLGFEDFQDETISPETSRRSEAAGRSAHAQLEHAINMELPGVPTGKERGNL